MNMIRSNAAAAFLSEENLWWVTGGWNGTDPGFTSEYLDGNTGQFVYYVDIPEALDFHNLVQINQTHFFMLDGLFNEGYSAYMFDR